MSDKINVYYTTQDLIDKFRVSRYAITRAINSGKLIVSKKEGTKNLFSKESVERYLEISEQERQVRNE